MTDEKCQMRYGKPRTRLFLGALGVLAVSLNAVLSFPANSIARVAQWIRALASGARGRRFDPCRGYHFPFKLFRQSFSVMPPGHKLRTPHKEGVEYALEGRTPKRQH